MLMQSARHRKDDLDFWDDLIASDMVHRIPNWKVERARKSIIEFGYTDCFIGVSGGKDSMVTLDLVMGIHPTVPVVWIEQPPWDPVETVDVISAAENRYGISILRVVADYSGIQHDESNKPYEDKVWADALRTAHKMFGRRHISGIRRDESRVRRIRHYLYGEASENSLAPITGWSDSDVFAYLAQNDLPTHATYAMTGGGRWDRTRLRVDALGGWEGEASGRHLWEAEYYGDEIRKIHKMSS